jgi:hypothetical protein
MYKAQNQCVVPAGIYNIWIISIKERKICAIVHEGVYLMIKKFKYQAEWRVQAFDL